jgi:hypothetical protein
MIREYSFLLNNLLLLGVRIFKNTWFARFAGKEGITDSELKALVNELEDGQADANLGGDVYKIRVSRTGKGKSGGYRVIVFFKSGNRTFYVYGFAKSVMGNIDEKQLRDFKRTAKALLALSDDKLKDLLNTGDFLEI